MSGSPSSILRSPWHQACQQSLIASESRFLQVTNLLLERVNLNSSHLFRADILSDTANELALVEDGPSSPIDTVDSCGCSTVSPADGGREGSSSASVVAELLEETVGGGWMQYRRVRRRLIPRNIMLDSPMEQTCVFYTNSQNGDCDGNRGRRTTLVVFVPHCAKAEEMPWYHPRVRALAYMFKPTGDDGDAAGNGLASELSIHYLPFENTQTDSNRLERTFLSLLKTYARLVKNPGNHNNSQEQAVAGTPSSCSNRGTSAILDTPFTTSSLRDTILPQSRVQNTYSRLKHTHAPHLIKSWVEKTEPSKHVFEDISIAAFLIELWKDMYESEQFLGFVDIACGNGVLVYLLVQEGYTGYGLDARHRQTWDVLGLRDKYCFEKAIVPKAFLNTLNKGSIGVDVHDGMFEAGTFVISNHADELTCWTPLIASLHSPPLPFLAIPCCSHALDGSRTRYGKKDIKPADSILQNHDTDDHRCDAEGQAGNEDDKVEEQPQKGDLKALKAKNTGEKSQYALLTKKTISLAMECDLGVEVTMLRIPSTRNTGVVSGRQLRQDDPSDSPLDAKTSSCDSNKSGRSDDSCGKRIDQVRRIIARECAGSGGVEGSARTWIEKVKKLNGGQGRGKVNLKGKIDGMKAVEKLEHIDEPS